ncbi:hypothetical protein IWQ61_003617 [Dispira simplex]|nr:hypothetical protein IWQ61_003617 [Dispira simplex]
MSDHDLTHNEIWDDSDLVTAWEEALREYRVEHNKPFRLTDVMEAQTETVIPGENDSNLSDQTDMVEVETATDTDETPGMAMEITATLNSLGAAEVERSSKREAYIRAFETMKTQHQKDSSVEKSSSQKTSSRERIPETKGTGSTKTTRTKRPASTMDSDHEIGNFPSVNANEPAYSYPHYPPSDYLSYYGYYPSPWNPPTWDSTGAAGTHYASEQPSTASSNAWSYGARPLPPLFATHHPFAGSTTPSHRPPPTAIPRPPPPPLIVPPTMSRESKENQMDDSALANLLLSWYTAGYYTGLYQNRTYDG